MTPSLAQEKRCLDASEVEALNYIDQKCEIQERNFLDLQIAYDELARNTEPPLPMWKQNQILIPGIIILVLTAVVIDRQARGH